MPGPLAAGYDAYRFQKADDAAAENVHVVFIEDAMMVHGIGKEKFAEVEAEADRLWCNHLKKVTQT